MTYRSLLFRITIVIFLVTVSFRGNAGLNKCPSPDSRPNTARITENKGQICDQYFQERKDVLYHGTDGKLVFFIRDNGVSYQLYKSDRPRISAKASSDTNSSSALEMSRIDIKWINSNSSIRTARFEELSGYENYYLAQCPNGALNVKSFAGVFLRDVYQGIDVKYTTREGFLKCDFIVAPYTDYKKIQLEVKGADIEMGEGGTLLLKTSVGTVQEGAPVVYQKGKRLKARWNVEGNVLSFVVDNFDRTQVMVIDPPTRVWGTYYGPQASPGYEKSCRTDQNGDVYIGGACTSSSLIATSGAFQTVIGGKHDAFLAKFDGGGTRLWATFLGGAAKDLGNGCALDNNGNIYLTGTTASTNVGVFSTTGSHQPVYGAGEDAFLTKFSSAGVRLWSTYYGGSGTEIGSSAACDAAGNAFIVGTTGSTNSLVISSAGAYQTVMTGLEDGFVAKFSSSGVRLWGTYYGDVSKEEVTSCAVDAQGRILVAGTTYYNSSSSAIATPGSFQTAYGGGPTDVFLFQLSSSGNRLWGTYYGGLNQERYPSCSVDGAGNVYLAGHTDSSDSLALATPGSHKTTYSGGGDGFLAKFTSIGLRVWGTYYGGAGTDYALFCSTDKFGNIYTGGFTTSLTDIATASSHQPIFGGGFSDSYLALFNNSGQRLWGTYYGGAGDDEGLFCDPDTLRNVYMVGNTLSSTGIATSDAYQTTLDIATASNYIVKLYTCDQPTINVISNDNILCVGESATLTASGASSYLWSGGQKTSTVSVTPTTTTHYTVTGADVVGCRTQYQFSQPVDACTSLKRNLIAGGFSIYPNPGSGIFFVDSHYSNCEFSVFNSLGQLIMHFSAEKETSTIDLRNCSDGLFQLIVTVENRQVYSQKLLKQRN